MVINEKLRNDIDSDEDIRNRKPKPFRYISDLNEITDEVIDSLLNQKTVMTDEITTSQKLREHFENTVGVGDIDIIEHVVNKHKKKRQNHQNVGFM